MDLRGRPELAKRIAEGDGSPALRDLLTKVADRNSPIFTLGCDLGSHLEPTNVPLRRRMVAGGYVQMAGIHYDQTATDAYAALANFLVTSVGFLSAQDDWRIDFVGAGVNFKFEDEPQGFDRHCGYGSLRPRPMSIWLCNRANG